MEQHFKKTMYGMERRVNRGAIFIPIFIGGVFLFTLIVMLLWNAVLPAVLGVKAISYWQAMGIFALSKVLFGFNSGWGGKRQQWKQKMEAKWANMSPEDRENFKTEWRNRCGPGWRRFSTPGSSEGKQAASTEGTSPSTPDGGN